MTIDWQASVVGIDCAGPKNKDWYDQRQNE
jgi:hypothetical protein